MTTTLDIQTQKDIPVNIGIDRQDRSDIAEGLSKVLAGTYTLYLKTHNFHWNVTGPLFHSLHELFEGQYRDLAEAVDAIAERIRTIGFPAPGSFSEFMELSPVSETRGIPSTEDMIRLLTEGNEIISREARQVLQRAEEVSDEPTVDLLTQRMQVHEENAWMLRSHLEQR